MDATGVVFRPPSGFSGAGIDARFHSSSKASLSGLSVDGGTHLIGADLRLFGSRGSRVRKFGGFSNSGFCDNGHVQYYNVSTPATANTPAVRCGGGKKDKVKEKEMDTASTVKKTMKKRLKLLKGLSKDLSMFSEMGFGLDPQNEGLVDEVRGKMISEATELLLGQLQQLRAKEEELKRQRKEEKAKLKAARMQNRLDCEDSSSSSESSDSECGEVVEVGSLKSEEAHVPPVVNELQPVPSMVRHEGNVTNSQPVSQDAIAAIPTIPSDLQNLSCSNVSIGGSYDATRLMKKIEVCMGGKCKKSGGAALLGEFQRVLGDEGAVVGCKCMGKCRDGPNVRVLNCADGVQALQGLDDSVRTPTNPLCIGVGFEDVGLIISNFFGETQKDMGPAAAS